MTNNGWTCRSYTTAAAAADMRFFVNTKGTSCPAKMKVRAKSQDLPNKHNEGGGGGSGRRSCFIVRTTKPQAATTRRTAAEAAAAATTTSTTSADE
jgi:hypothetical protein